MESVPRISNFVDTLDGLGQLFEFISILKFIEGPLERMQGELHYRQQITMKIVILRIMIEQEGEDIILFWMRFYG